MTETLDHGARNSAVHGSDRKAGACTHRHGMSMAATELGYHARCLQCGAIGPGSTSIKAARRTLLAMAKDEDREHLRYLV